MPPKIIIIVTANRMRNVLIVKVNRPLIKRSLSVPLFHPSDFNKKTQFTEVKI